MGRQSFHKFTLERVLCLFLSAAKLLEAKDTKNKNNNHPVLRWISIEKETLTAPIYSLWNPDMLRYLIETWGICLS